MAAKLARAAGAMLAVCLFAGCGDHGPIGTPVPPPEPEAPITMEGSVSFVPHSATSCTADCLRCHATGANGAPLQAHPDRTECLLCHVVLTPSDGPR